MSGLPVSKIVLYKHGVGYIERRGKLDDDELNLEFKDKSMNDVLKSLVVTDGAGKVINVSYESYEDIEKKLGDCFLIPDNDAVLGLIRALKGNEVIVTADNQIKGKVIGTGERNSKEGGPRPSLSLLDDNGTVHLIDILDIRNIKLSQKSSVDDLQHSLALSIAEKKQHKKNASVVLSKGREHDIRLSYIIEFPVWRVSYRFAFGGKDALLQGWGIIDNPLDEDLDDVDVSLVAGKPISFVYDFYAPPVSHRSVIKEYASNVKAPIKMETSVRSRKKLSQGGAAAPKPSKMVANSCVESESEQMDFEDSAVINTRTQELGALFRYDIKNPVTIKRGRSAMLPIIQQKIGCEKVNIFNASKNPKNPMAAIRFPNKTGLSLERGPLTVYDSGTYAGEAILPFTPEGTEQLVVYAVELGAEVKVETDVRRKFINSYLSGVFFVRCRSEEKTTTYSIHNKTKKPMKIMIEHPRDNSYKLVKTNNPDEKTHGHYRWNTEVPGDSERSFDIHEVKEVSYEESIRDLSLESLENYFRWGEVTSELKERMEEVIEKYKHIQDMEKEKKLLTSELKRLEQEQSRLRDNIGAISQNTAASDLAKRYISQLEKEEDRIQQVNARITEIEREVLGVEKEIKKTISAW